MAALQVSIAELRKHDRREDCWIAVHSKVWDFTDFVDEHPGGSESKLLLGQPEIFDDGIDANIS